jgi:hypothetical protein
MPEASDRKVGGKVVILVTQTGLVVMVMIWEVFLPEGTDENHEGAQSFTIHQLLASKSELCVGSGMGRSNSNSLGIKLMW